MRRAQFINVVYMLSMNYVLIAKFNKKQPELFGISSSIRTPATS